MKEKLYQAVVKDYPFFREHLNTLVSYVEANPHKNNFYVLCEALNNVFESISYSLNIKGIKSLINYNEEEMKILGEIVNELQRDSVTAFDYWGKFHVIIMLAEKVYNIDFTSISYYRFEVDLAHYIESIDDTSVIKYKSEKKYVISTWINDVRIVYNLILGKKDSAIFAIGKERYLAVIEPNNHMNENFAYIIGSDNELFGIAQKFYTLEKQELVKHAFDEIKRKVNYGMTIDTKLRLYEVIDKLCREEINVLIESARNYGTIYQRYHL